MASTRRGVTCGPTPCPPTDPVTPAILLALASAALLGAGVVTAQFALRYVEPISGAAISVPSFTLLFLLLSPLVLWHEPVVLDALPVFVVVGLFYPAMLTFLTFLSNRALGPVITSTLGNLAPLFAVLVAISLLHENMRPFQSAGLLVAMVGAIVISKGRGVPAPRPPQGDPALGAMLRPGDSVAPPPGGPE